MDNVRIARIKPISDYVSPWGEPGRISTGEKIITELGNYNIISVGDRGVDDYKLELYREVALMNQLLHANIIIFSAGLYLADIARYNGDFIDDIPDETVNRVIERLDATETRDNNLNPDELFIAVKSNIYMYYIAIFIYIQSDHNTLGQGDIDKIKEDMDEGEMGEDDDDIDIEDIEDFDDLDDF
jgi:hypothetical protein